MAAPPLPPFDPDVPALTTLLGEEAAEVVGVVVGAAGGSLRSLITSQVRYVPGRSVTAQYRCDVTWSDGANKVETFVAMSGIPVPDEVPVLQQGDVSIAVFRFPNDPFLPGLPAAVDSARTARLLEQLGEPPAEARLRTRAYRAGRRAVVEVTTGKARLFIKVLRPKRAAALQERHQALAASVPVPHSHGWSGDLGLVALEAMPGKTLRKALESGSKRVPEPAQLIELLDRFPQVDGTGEAVAGPVARAPDHARLIATVMPALADRLDALVEGLGAVESGDDRYVHGDFHSSQVLTRGGDIVGLVDVDTAGRGDRADDLATMIGHLSTLALESSARRTIDAYGRTLVRAFDVLVDPASLRMRVAAVVLGFATGPFRVQLPTWQQQTERRVAMAEKWMRADS